MKKILIGISFILFLTHCAKKDIEYKSTLEFNQKLILETISLWKDGLILKDSFTSGRINQFNKDMSIFYQDDFSSNTKELNPFYYNTISPYFYNNGNNNTSILKYILEKNQIKISDSLSFNKELSVETDNSKLMTTNITITLYKTEYNSYNSWFIGKINHNELYKDSEGFSMPIFSYRYALKNNRILSFLMCNVNYEIEKNKNTFLIKLNEIDVINDKLEYEDFTKEHLNILSKSLKKQNINVSYK